MLVDSLILSVFFCRTGLCEEGYGQHVHSLCPSPLSGQRSASDVSSLPGLSESCRHCPWPEFLLQPCDSCPGSSVAATHVG